MSASVVQDGQREPRVIFIEVAVGVLADVIVAAVVLHDAPAVVVEGGRAVHGVRETGTITRNP
jgi:hypothetical protein